MIYAICIVIVLVGIEWRHHRQYKQLSDANDKLLNFMDKRQTEWQVERQQLLDRIQAPSFDHLKQAEVRIIKAHNNEKEPPKLEQL